MLIFCQMTKMIDILEEYMTKKRFNYFRMDGSTNIADRRDMVNEFQVNENVFAFLLSTRAGGLGVNLTGADTVIFYDNDWNPTMDAQATDRAHRIGQTKPVSVYRLITKNSVEERILKRAREKQNVQTTVYSGNAAAKNFEMFKPAEIFELLYSEEEVKKIEEERKRVKEEYNMRIERNKMHYEEIELKRREKKMKREDEKRKKEEEKKRKEDEKNERNEKIAENEAKKLIENEANNSKGKGIFFVSHKG